MPPRRGAYHLSCKSGLQMESSANRFLLLQYTKQLLGQRKSYRFFCFSQKLFRIAGAV